MSTLSETLDFDHVIEVLPDGTWRDAPGLYAPDAVDVDGDAVTLEGWDLPLSGFTGQYGYTGPWLHDSEIIEGGVERYVFEHPGYWVAIYGQHTCEECGGAGLLWAPAGGGGEIEIDCPLECEPGGEIGGWTLAFKPAAVSA